MPSRTTSPLRRILLTLLSLCGILWQPGHANTENLPNLGDESATVISPLQERKLGEEFMRQARRSLKIIDDPELNEYIQRLGKRLVAHSDSPRQEFFFFLVDDRQVNAFAVPGGFIGVNTGLVLASRSESELAAVMAHETAHVTQRHIPRMLVQQRRAAGQTLAALMAAILLAGSGNDGGGAALAVTTATVAQQQLNFSRDFEEEADRIGMTILAESGFDPKAMPAFFEHLQTANRLNESDLPEFLRTHPITTRRIAESSNRAEQYAKAKETPPEDFLHAQAKIRAIASEGNPAETVKVFQHNLAQGRQHADSERYGYALALLQNRQYDQARSEIDKLVQRHPDNPSYKIVRAEIELAAGRFDSALGIYEKSWKQNPSYRPLAQQYASALLKTGHPQKAREILKEILGKHPDEPALYLMLTTASGDTGRPLEAHRAMAEYYYLSGQAKTAIEQLQIATRFAGDDFYTLSSLEARIKAIKEEIALYQEY